MNDFYSSLENKLIGFDGGNISAPLWLSGLEWGTSDEEITDEITRPTYISSNYVVPHLSPEWKDNNPNFYKWQFDQKIAKILCHVFDFKGHYKEYMQNHYCDKNSNEFKINLFPLPAANIDSWLDDHVLLTKTKIKYHYKTYCANTRFKLLNDLVSQFKPQVIVCFGQGHTEEFKLAFWDEEYSSQVNEQTVTISERNTIKILSSNHATKLIIAPFLGRNLTADIELNRIAEEVKNHLIG
ncbi:hypothetical protein [Shewanella sp. CG12_big_fil_rev_8_21_14_0_65_47_15]|uniref:hypothetical protein n=1 Tax=Shewanella sp. CG12_big_fil_rev_8_21_14_0_65_47_15 TaxID=1975537 RepID=UPI000CBBFEC4|nr:hypothetical protein [Shewanella sp. CG12_big_fil_rev_8_21_14_0_65_47_15]PIW59955.1 MAG: hypothetical protein COW15_14935 [Shewanella sp. CG12_big_fil_rev_8_21_14_0_65_47_15]